MHTFSEHVSLTEIEGQILKVELTHFDNAVVDPFTLSCLRLSWLLTGLSVLRMINSHRSVL